MARKLKINWAELDAAFQTNSWERSAVGRAKSLTLTEEGLLRAQELVARYTLQE